MKDSAIEKYLANLRANPHNTARGYYNPYADPSIGVFPVSEQKVNIEAINTICNRNIRAWLYREVANSPILVIDRFRYLDAIHTGIPLVSAEQLGKFGRFYKPASLPQSKLTSKLSRLVCEVLGDAQTMSLVPFHCCASLTPISDREMSDNEFGFYCQATIELLKTCKTSPIIALGKNTSVWLKKYKIKHEKLDLPSKLDTNWQGQLKKLLWST
jgi:hypothetical protein